MRVAVIGAGAVGTALATALAAGGQEVVVGRRDSVGRPGGAPPPHAEELICATGLRPVGIGGPEAADVLDDVARLWFALALGQGRGRRVGFRVLEDAA